MRIKSTTFAIDDIEHLNPIIIEKEMSTRNAIREFIQCQTSHIFGAQQNEDIQNTKISMNIKMHETKIM
uniref:Uncharacterized protein n=1 Tax=viral metagenome TaxID=1070528 RepID=A0A6C0KRG8_9ZZZZ